MQGLFCICIFDLRPWFVKAMTMTCASVYLASTSSWGVWAPDFVKSRDYVFYSCAW